MNFHVGRNMRAFKPSETVAVDSREVELDKQLRKQRNIELYAQRVRQGLPLFDDEPEKPRK